MKKIVAVAVFALALQLLPSGPLGRAVLAQQMPDPSLIHGRAIPAPELADGTITVRVVRESIGNDIAGQQVTVTSGDTTRTAATDTQGRAEFRGLPQGGQATAKAVVDGEALVSQPFQVPATGGIRVILVAGLAQAAERRKAEAEAAAAAPPTKGVVVFGENSRIVMQFEGDTLQVYYVFEIVNNARTRVDIGGPLIIDLPKEAVGPELLQGSSPSASIRNNRVIVGNPLAAGTTSIQVGYTLPFYGSDLTLAQPLPAALQAVTVGVEKVGGLAISSPQFASTRDLQNENGTSFIVGNGSGLPAHAVLTINITGLPAHSRMPRYVALGLAGIILAAGVWLSVKTGNKDARARETLVNRREELLKQLTQLESNRRAGSVPQERYANRRQKILSELEQIYGELDEAGLGPQGGGEGVAA